MGLLRLKSGHLRHMKSLLTIVFTVTCLAYNLHGQNDDFIQLESPEFCFIDDAVLDSGGVQVLYGIYFLLGSKELIDTNNACILAIADYMQRHPKYIFEIGYHRDCRGSDAMSYDLSKYRAKSIANRLVELGIDPQRIFAKGYGESTPVIKDRVLMDCDYIISRPIEEQEILHALNRRVEIKIISKVFVP